MAMCFTALAAYLAHSSHGSRHGILTGYIMPILDRDSTKCLLVEDILWGSCSPKSGFNYSGDFLPRLRHRARKWPPFPIWVTPILQPFKKSRFLPTRRVLHCYLTFSSSDLPLENLAIHVSGRILNRGLFLSNT